MESFGLYANFGLDMELDDNYGLYADCGHGDGGMGKF